MKSLLPKLFVLTSAVVFYWCWVSEAVDPSEPLETKGNWCVVCGHEFVCELGTWRHIDHVNDLAHNVCHCAECKGSFKINKEWKYRKEEPVEDVNWFAWTRFFRGRLKMKEKSEPTREPPLYDTPSAAVEAQKRAGKDLLVKILPRPGVHPSNAQTHLLRTVSKGVRAIPQDS